MKGKAIILDPESNDSTVNGVRLSKEALST